MKIYDFKIKPEVQRQTIASIVELSATPSAAENCHFVGSWEQRYEIIMFVKTNEIVLLCFNMII